MSASTLDIKNYMEERRALIESALPQALQPVCRGAEQLFAAMEYSLMAGGKRLRPLLFLAALESIAAQDESIRAEAYLPFACGIEMIHTYSLIHDDLPAMDDDDLRRGRPSCHKAFDEATAILAGDGLLNMAYETMLEADFTQNHPAEAVCAMKEIACRAGVRGMVAGQTLDVKLEGKEPSMESVRYIHLHKTADLLTAPVVAGLMLAGASEEQLEAARAYGRGLGLAFQIVDDLLDLEGDVAALGKETGMDAQRGKMTWPAVRGVDQAREDARMAVEEAVNAMLVFGERGKKLSKLAQESLVRKM